jgi:hypothetical protein
VLHLCIARGQKLGSGALQVLESPRRDCVGQVAPIGSVLFRLTFLGVPNMKKFAIAGAAVLALSLSACYHHKEPVMVKGYAPVAEAPVQGVAPAANWK